MVARGDKLVTGPVIKSRLTTGNHPPEFHAVGVDKPGGAGIVGTSKAITPEMSNNTR